VAISALTKVQQATVLVLAEPRRLDAVPEFVALFDHFAMV